MILVYGTICLDRTRRVSAMPPRGGYVEIASEHFFLGGEAANTANALRQWGASVVLEGNEIGRDAMGEGLGSKLAENGLETAVSGTCSTPVCDIYVDDDAERTMIGQGFSTMSPSVEPVRVNYSGGEWFTAEPNMLDASRTATRLAYEAGMKIYTMDFVRDGDSIFPGSFCQSSTDWAGVRGDREANLAWVEDWVARHGCFAILTDGPRGFVAGSPELPVRHYPAYPADKVVDATGAGDLFRAGMLYGLDRGWPVERCLQFGAAAGCLACRSLGATAGVPTVEEIEALIASHSW